METVCVRFEKEFIRDIEEVMKENRYTTKTEFIREAVREKIKDLEKEAALIRLERAYGAGTKKGRKISDDDIHKAGESAVREIAEQLGVKL